MDARLVWMEPLVALEWVAFLHAVCLLRDPKIRSCNEDGKRKRVRWRVTGRFEWGSKSSHGGDFPMFKFNCGF